VLELMNGSWNEQEVRTHPFLRTSTLIKEEDAREGISIARRPYLKETAVLA
jgi:hypothetical protein